MTKSNSLMIVLAWIIIWSPAMADWKVDIGYTSLKTRLGAGEPTGAGIGVTQVEAKQSGNYMPDVHSPDLAGKTLTPMSGNSGVSSHATTVAMCFYGLTGSIAPGVANIDIYEASGWLMGILNFGFGFPPEIESRRVQNHSWIGTFGVDEADRDTLVRFDLLADRDGVVVAAGVNNGAGSTMPRLLASAYNVLAVGLTDGQSSYGPTLLAAPGRVKPDIVAPAGQTSWATPMVASSAALLLETADANGILSSLPVSQRRTGKALLVKALLMAGATKAECAGWRKGFATPATDGTVPLDYRYGAGELNIDNSHRILTTGQQPASASADVSLAGWDYGMITADSSARYFFEVPAGQYIQDLSILVTWNRHIEAVDDPDLGFMLNPSLANIDLHLFQADGHTSSGLVDQSVSAVDNVEHIYLTNLDPGRYVFELSSDLPWPYAVAWDIMPGLATAGDVNHDGHVDVTDLLYFVDSFGSVTGDDAYRLASDFNGDNGIDVVDLLLLVSNWGR